jgi:acetylglutamate kinase
VVASIGYGEDGSSFNINADLVAGELAAALGSEKVIFLTDVDGLYRDFQDKTSLISALSLGEARDKVETGALAAGMIPKVGACVAALAGGVRRAHILNGTIPHALLLEVYTDEGVGTMITHAGNGKVG